MDDLGVPPFLETSVWPSRKDAPMGKIQGRWSKISQDWPEIMVSTIQILGQMDQKPMDIFIWRGILFGNLS